MAKRKFEIFWSPEAEETYLATLVFILNEWPVEVAEDFEALVENLLERLRRYKYLSPPSAKFKELRRCVIS